MRASSILVPDTVTTDSASWPKIFGATRSFLRTRWALGHLGPIPVYRGGYRGSGEDFFKPGARFCRVVGQLGDMRAGSTGLRERYDRE